MYSRDPRFQLYDAIYENVERLHSEFNNSAKSEELVWEDYVSLKSRFFQTDNEAFDFTTQDYTSFHATKAVITGFGLETLRSDDSRVVGLNLFDDGSPYARDADLDDSDIEVVEAAKYGQHVINCGPDQPPTLFIFERFGSLLDSTSKLRYLHYTGLSEMPSATRCLKVIEGLSKISLADIDFDGYALKI